MDKISVVVPVYKVEEYLDQCVKSLLAQTYHNFEIILVDDGSPDRCPAMCDEYEQRENRIHVIHQKNGGLSAARNTGIEWVLEKNESQWITFVDSDDWVHPQYLEQLSKSVKKYGGKMAFGKFAYLNDRNVNNTEAPDALVLRDVNAVYQDNDFDPNSACGRLFRLDLWQDIRFPVGKLHEDRFTTYKLLFQQKQVAVVDYPIYFYYMNYEGICRSEWNYRKLNNLEAAEAQIAFFEQNHLDEAWLYTEHQYTKLLINAMKELAAYDKNDHKTYAKLQGKLRKQLWQKGTRLGYRFFTNIHIYKYAWPIPAKIWLRLQSMIKKKG